MAFEVKFYSFAKKLNSTKRPSGTPRTYQCEIKTDCDIINPTIILSGTNTEVESNYNYCYISNFGRYYFITDEPIFRSNVIILRMTCDPLMSYKEVLLNNEVYVDRYENSTKDLPDSLQAIKPNINTQIVPFNTVNLQRDSFVVAITGDGE